MLTHAVFLSTINPQGNLAADLLSKKEEGGGDNDDQDPGLLQWGAVGGGAGGGAGQPQVTYTQIYSYIVIQYSM